MSQLAVIEKLEEKIRGLDMTPVLHYSNKLEEMTKASNTMVAPMYLKDFIVAMDKANDLVAKAQFFYGQAKSALDLAEATAYFDNAGQYLESKGVKDTSEARKRYVDLDPDVQKAKDVVSRAESMLEFLKVKRQEFKMAHEAVKKIAYSSDYNNSPDEGM